MHRRIPARPFAFSNNEAVKLRGTLRPCQQPVRDFNDQLTCESGKIVLRYVSFQRPPFTTQPLWRSCTGKFKSVNDISMISISQSLIVRFNFLSESIRRLSSFISLQPNCLLNCCKLLVQEMQRLSDLPRPILRQYRPIQLSFVSCSRTSNPTNRQSENNIQKNMLNYYNYIIIYSVTLMCLESDWYPTHLLMSTISSSLVHSVPPFCFQLRQLSHFVRHCFSVRVMTRSATTDHDRPLVMLSPGNNFR